MNSFLFAGILKKRSKIVFNIAWVIISALGYQKSHAQSIPTFAQVPVTSPDAAVLQKFTDYPVSLNTGLIDISIPLYTIQANGINVPVELKYHAAGIKYDDNCQGVGIGWSLFSGGMITGIVQGITDSGPAGSNNYFKSAGSINPHPSCSIGQIGNDVNGENTALMNFDRGYEDSEYDIFNYSFPGNTGKFFYPGTSTPVVTPSKKLLITRYGVPSNNIGGYSFDITDMDGTLYKFGYYTGSSTIAKEQSFFGQGTCNFLLTEIISANKADTVKFNYSALYGDDGSQVSPSSKLVINDQVAIRDQYQEQGKGITQGGNFLPNPHETSASNFIQSFGYVQLTGITFRTGHVVFSYNTQHQLTGANVYNNFSSAPIKAITLQQSSFGTDYYKLDQLNFYDSALQQSYNYKFTYNGTPYNKFHTGIDYWGFYNGATYTTDYIPNFQVLTDNNGSEAVGSMDRTPNEVAMKLGMLNKITYPTGGSSVFTFEAHRYSGGQLAGGLRIKEIDNYDLNGSYINSKWYKYGQTENGDGTIYKTISPADFCYTDLDVFSEGVYTNNGQTNAVSPAYVYLERVYGAFPKFSYSWGGSSVVYDYVTEYTGDGTNANGKTVYQYENFVDQFNSQSFSSYLPMVSKSNNWKTGQLLSKQAFSLSGSTYTPIYTLTNQYQDFNAQDYQCLKIIPYVNWHDNGMSQEDRLFGLQCFRSINVPLSNLIFRGANLTSVHAYADYFLSTGVRLLTSSTETKDGASVVNQYTYDPVYLKPVKVITNKSNGDNKRMEYTYPFNLTAAPYPAMTNLNMIEPVIVQNEYKNNDTALLTSTNTNYADWGHNLIAPQTVVTQWKTNVPDTRLVYDAYDNWGNITQRHPAKGVSEAYIWGYNHRYPIAAAKNAKSNDIFYESFEEGNGNSALNDGQTGHYSHTGTYSKVLTGLDAGNYVLSYWQKSGSTWSQVNTPVTVSGSTYTISLNAQIDDVKIYPQDAQMITYTYDPLIGMTSMTDTRGQTTYYEYDNFQRLINVKDKDRNIIKSYCYNYTGQNGCQISSIPQVGNGVATRTLTRQCGTGYAGSSVAYTVPANTYYAANQTAADQLAQNDLNANAQNYANAQGSCTLVCTGNAYKVINNICEQGNKVYTKSGVVSGHYVCVYHYEWSDGSYSADYSENSPTACAI